jgi:hypothetical protein
MKCISFCCLLIALAVLPLSGLREARAWDYEGHRLVNQLALASLPTNFPSFVFTPAARERIAFLSGEPDRWRSTPDLALKHCNGPDHYLDIEDLAPMGLKPSNVSPLRYVFTAQLAVARQKNPGAFAPIDAARDPDQTKALPGFLPWTINEYAGKLKSAFSYLREFERGGTAEEVANAQANIIYLMGVMGHFVGDGSQPLHTTRHYNGWVGDNPNRYTTTNKIHSWIDGGYLNRIGLKPMELFAKVRPARLLTSPDVGGSSTNLFPVVMEYLQESFRQVEPLYELERDGKLSERQPASPEGYQFITGRLLAAGQMLGDLWLTARHDAPADNFLRGQLTRRKLTAESPVKGSFAPEGSPKAD